MIELIGLGPAGADGMSLAAREALRAAPRVILRTAVHPAAQDLAAEGLSFESLDSVYDSAPDFDALYPELAEAVLKAARDGDVAYAVPGHPLVAEESVRILIRRAREEGIPVRVVGSASFIEASMAAMGVSIEQGLILIDALSAVEIPTGENLPVLIYQVYDTETASRVKLKLMERYPEEHEVVIIQRGGAADSETVLRAPLHRLDRIAVDHLTAVYVPPVPPEQRRKTFGDLVQVMARLRGEGGCPWDREQDHHTLKRYLIEECYEVIEAIERDDLDHLAEELGDLLLQVVFHAQLEAETGAFTIDDVITLIVEKLIRRHPHVFGETEVADAEEVLRNWEIIKKSEKAPGWRESALDGVPAGLPALMRAMEISKRAVKVGFEWERFEDVLAKLDEEVRELRQALEFGGAESVRDELGDLLFTVVNVARWKSVDAEEALRAMLNRFSTRFRFIEESARRQGRSLSEMTLAEMDALWDEAKRLGVGDAPHPEAGQ